MKQSTVPCILAALLVTGGLHATPLETGHLPDHANWYLHADLDRLRGTTVGTTLMEAIEDEHGKQLKAVKRMFSLNPFTDLHGITLWGNGEKDHAALIIRGNFDREHLTDLISAAKDHDTSAHHGQTIHSWKDDKEKAKTQHGAFFGEDLVVISQQRRLLLQTLDVLDGRSGALEAAPANQSASFLLGVVDLGDLELEGDDAELLRKVRSLRMACHEKDGRMHADLTLVASGADEAERFAKVLGGLVALGELADKNIAALELESTVSVREGTTVHATLSIPSTHILAAMEEAGALGKR